MGCNVIILEDNDVRIHEFKNALRQFGHLQLHFWHNAHRMISECPRFLPDCCLISLDHDLNPEHPVGDDPGTGLNVAEFLGRQKAVCPVIIHTSNVEGRWSMFNELRFGGWTAEIVGPIGEDWIQNSWLLKAKTLIESHKHFLSRI